MFKKVQLRGITTNRLREMYQNELCSLKAQDGIAAIESCLANMKLICSILKEREVYSVLLP